MGQFYVATGIARAYPSEKLQDHPNIDNAILSTLGYAVSLPPSAPSRWMPSDAFEAAYLPLGDIGELEPWKQRLVAEFTQLHDRAVKLELALANPNAPFSDEDREILTAQLDIMKSYYGLLALRMSRAGITSDRPEVTNAIACAALIGAAKGV